MINIYTNEGAFVANAPSIRVAASFTKESTSTIFRKLNNPKPNNEYYYYTDDERGTLIRYTWDSFCMALGTPYPTSTQITNARNALKELLK